MIQIFCVNIKITLVLIFSILTEISLADNIDIEKIPDAIPRGVFKKVALPGDTKPTFITFDLETTDKI